MYVMLVLAAVAELNECRNQMRIQRRTLRDGADPFAMPEERFIELFRLTKEVAQVLVEEMSPHMVQGHRRTFIPIPIKICAALHFFASGSYQMAIAHDFCAPMSRTMVSRAVNEVSSVLDDHLAKKWIRFPRTDEYGAIKQRFLEGTGFPGVIGVIDCTHVRIQKPNREVQHCYLNRGGFHSKNVQLICDLNLEIFGVFARFGGATEDSYIWDGCGIRALLEKRYEENETNQNTYLLGDSGYPLQPWLITPYRPSTSQEERRFNTHHARARNCAERLNGVLKSVFRCLKVGLPFSPQVTGKMINACCVLHNFRRSHGLVDLDDVIEVYDDIEVDEDEEAEEIVFGLDDSPVQLCAARTIRNGLKMDLKCTQEKE